MQGLANLRGQVATAIDLKKLFSIVAVPCQQDEATSFHIIIERPEGLLALRVDEVGDVFEANQSEVHVAPAQLNKTMGRYLAKSLRIENQIVPVLNVDAVSEAVIDQPVQFEGEHYG